MDLESSSRGTRRIAVAVVAALLAHGALALAAPVTPTVATAKPRLVLVWLEERALPVVQPAEGGAPSNTPTAIAPKRRAQRITRPAAVTRDAQAAATSELAAPTGAHDTAAAPTSEVAAPEGAHATLPSASNEGMLGTMAGALVPAHGPALLPSVGSCASHFPPRARVDHGEVQVIVDVDATGHARVTNVLAEYPNGQGFDAAARRCTANLRFDPAIDAHGTKIGGHAKLRLRFDRRRA